jgi:hypothetical protein
MAVPPQLRIPIEEEDRAELAPRAAGRPRSKDPKQMKRYEAAQARIVRAKQGLPALPRGRHKAAVPIKPASAARQQAREEQKDLEFFKEFAKGRQEQIVKAILGKQGAKEFPSVQTLARNAKVGENLQRLVSQSVEEGENRPILRGTAGLLTEGLSVRDREEMGIPGAREVGRERGKLRAREALEERYKKGVTKERIEIEEIDATKEFVEEICYYPSGISNKSLCSLNSPIVIYNMFCENQYKINKRILELRDGKELNLETRKEQDLRATQHKCKKFKKWDRQTREEFKKEVTPLHTSNGATICCSWCGGRRARVGPIAKPCWCTAAEVLALTPRPTQRSASSSSDPRRSQMLPRDQWRTTRMTSSMKSPKPFRQTPSSTPTPTS